MTITSMSDSSTMTGAPVQGSDGEKLGKVDTISTTTTPTPPSGPR
jgi:hypothetical protein